MRTLEEAIAEERAKADKARKSEAMFLRDGLIWNAKGEHRLAEKHEQIAEWLEELKAYRVSVLGGDMTQSMLKEERNKAIDELTIRLEKRFYGNEMASVTSKEVSIWNDARMTTLEFAEQLKAGRKK